MKLSAKMPAMMDAQMSPRQEAKMESKAPSIGGDGPMEAPQMRISQDTPAQVSYTNEEKKGPSWETADKKTGPAWEASDRKEA